MTAMPYSLQFELMVDINLSHDSLITLVKNQFRDRKKENYRSFLAEDNLIEVCKNHDFDPELNLVGEEGYLYTPYHIEITPMKNAGIEQDQIELARKMMRHLREKGATVVLLSAFEDKLE